MVKGRVAALDAGRALAIVGVVAVHLSFQFPNLPPAVTLMARMGQYGVQLFFVISAITIFMTLETDHERCSDARHVTLRFYIKRFFRIAPLYYAAIASFHFFAGTFRQTDRDLSLALYVVTVMAALSASYGLSRLTDRLIQCRATRLSRKLLSHVDGRFEDSRQM